MNNLDFESEKAHIKSVEELAQRIDTMRQTLAYDLQLGNDSGAKFSSEEYERLVVEYQEEVLILIDDLNYAISIATDLHEHLKDEEEEEVKAP